MKVTVLLAVAAGILCTTSSAIGQAVRGIEEEPVDVEVYKGPSLKKVGDNAYPAGALHKEEGWVILNMMVNPDGKAYELTVVDSFGGEMFEKSAIAALEKSTFQPATLGGKPVHSSYAMRVRFSAGGEKGASPEFALKYRHLLEAVGARNREAADELIVGLKPRNLYEDAYRNFALYRYHAVWGTEAEQLRDLRGATTGIRGDGFLGKKSYREAMAAQLTLELKRHEFGEALATWETFQKTTRDEATQPFENVMADILKLQATSLPVQTRAEIARGRSWLNRLFRRRFEIVVLDGAVEEIKVRCEKSYVFFRYEPGVQYSVNARDGVCTMEVVGEPGTRFDLVQS